MTPRYAFAEFTEELSGDPLAGHVYFKLFQAAKANLREKDNFCIEMKIDKLYFLLRIEQEEALESLDFLRDRRFISFREPKKCFFVIRPKKVPRCEKDALKRLLKKNLRKEEKMDDEKNILESILTGIGGAITQSIIESISVDEEEKDD